MNKYRYILFFLLFFIGINNTYAYDWVLDVSKLDYSISSRGDKLTISSSNTGIISNYEFGDYDLNGSSLEFIEGNSSTFNTYCSGYDKLFTKTYAFISSSWGTIDAYLCIKDSDGTFKILLENRDTIGIYNTNSGTTNGIFDIIRPTVTDDYSNDGVWSNSGSVTITLTPSDTGGSGIKETKYCITTGTTCTPSTVGTSLTISANYNGKVKYQTWDNAGNASDIGSIDVKLDNTKPTLTNLKKILIEATDTIDFSSSIYDEDTGGSGLDKYKINLYNGNTALTSNNFQSSYIFDFNNVNELYNIDSDGINNLNLKIQVKDLAGNESDIGQVDLDVIAGEIDSSSDTNFYEDISYDYKEYTINIKDKYSNVVRPISNIRKVSFTGSFDNTTKFINGSIGSVIYDKDNNSYIIGDTFGNTYTSGKIDGLYSLKVKSLVPTDESGYKYINGSLGDIKLKDFIVKEENIVDTSNYDISSINSNYKTNNSTVSHIKEDNLSFDAPLYIDLEASDAFRDGNNVLKVKFTNKTNSNFILNNFKLLLVHENDILFTPSITLSGSDIDSNTPSYDNSTKSFTFNVNLKTSLTILAKSSQTIYLVIDANLYRQDLGKIGYISYIPHDYNKIYNKITSYNTSTIGVGEVSGYNITSPITTYTTGGPSVDISEISIAGTTINTGTSGAIGNATGNSSSIFIDNGGIDKMLFKRDIKKSVSIFTRGVTSKNYTIGISIDQDDINNGGKVLYYDFSNQECNSIDGNKGCILTLDGNITNINGIHTIIVRGGSLYIKSDMTYQNKDSLLGIIVLKDDKKGGNIYIDPSITNIVGTIYADGSIMSYNGSTTEVSNLEPILGKQLYIYGNLFTANTIGGSYGNISSEWKCPYGSDYYEINNNGNCNTEGEAQKYDLVRLRNMVLVNDGTGTGALKYNSTSNEVIIEGLSGKRNYISDTGKDGLMVPDNNSAIVIKYNPQINFLKLPGFIIK